MAGVLKEYRCNECGRVFDSTVPSCIHCGTTNIKRIFLTPIAIKSDRTKLNDSNMEHLCESYGLTDFSNNESTKHDKSPALQAGWVAPNDAKTLTQLQTIVQDKTLNLGEAKVAPPSREVKNGSIDPRLLGGHGAGKLVTEVQTQGTKDRVDLETKVKTELAQGAA